MATPQRYGQSILMLIKLVLVYLKYRHIPSASYCYYSCSPLVISCRTPVRWRCDAMRRGARAACTLTSQSLPPDKDVSDALTN